MRLIILVALVGVLAFPAVAHADWRFDRAQAVAVKVFPQTPCHVTVGWADAEDYFDSTVITPFSRPRAWSIKHDCAVKFDSQYEQKWGFGWSELCTEMIHEYGHLNGLEHSSNPRSVMREFYDDGPPDARCARKGRAFLSQQRSARAGSARPSASARQRARAAAFRSAQAEAQAERVARSERATSRASRRPSHGRP